MPRLAFATCQAHPDLSPDDRPLVPLLQELGIEVTPLVWDRPGGEFDAVIVRSCWDYHHKIEAFRHWIGSNHKRLLNPPEVLQWNMDKRYLQDLAAWGALVPRTVWLSAPADLPAILHRLSVEEAVVKPAISMSGDDTWRTRGEGQARLDALLKTRTVMVQEFIPEILTRGELSLVFLGGVFSHAVSKRPRPGEFRIHEEHGGLYACVDPAPDLVGHAQALLDRLGPLLYARVDVVETRRGWMVMEVEVIDPSLYLRHAPGAAERFASAIASSLRADSSP
ncbi:MAG: ATP-grasp domain-containing protein [Candidatus Xenobia bacterium]